MGLTVLHQILYFSNKQEYKYDVSLHQVESCINIFLLFHLKSGIYIYSGIYILQLNVFQLQNLENLHLIPWVDMKIRLST